MYPSLSINLPFAPAQPASRTAATAKRLVFLGLVGSVMNVASAADSFNEGGKAKAYDDAVGGDSSPNKDINKALYDTSKGVSVMVWGPIMALILGGVVAWMIIAINKGGVFAAINSVLALVFGGFAASVVYTYLIASST